MITSALYIYANKAARQAVAAAGGRLLQVLSAQGQRRVTEAGYLPLSDSQMAQVRAVIEKNEAPTA